MSIEEQLAAGALKSWRDVIGRLSRIFELADEKTLEAQIAPGKNRVIYLLGHLIVAHDRMFPLMDLGPRLYAYLDEAYFDKPDRSLPDPVSSADLKSVWTDVTTKLTSALEALTPAQWLERHSAV